MPQYALRGVGPPHEKQQDVLNYIFEPDPDRVKQVDVSCGRAWGKTNLAIEAAHRALSVNSKQVGLFLEPDWKRVHRVFLKKWGATVPPQLYRLNKSENCIYWFNGSRLYYGPRNITGSIATMEDSQLGQDTTFVIDDEAALKCSYNFYVNTLATVREPSPVRFYLTISTPRVGAYRRLVMSPGHKLFMGNSYDNPYLPKGYVDNLVANMSEAQARREIYGEFISLEGKIWKEVDLQQPWPYGNVHHEHSSFNPDKPFWLFCDLGTANGAYAVVQEYEALHYGRRITDGSVWVIVADLCPHRDANAARAFNIIDQHFGTPAGVIGGRDLNKRSDTDAKTIAYFARQVWSNIQIYPVSEDMYSRQIQYDRMSYLVKSAKGDRRLCVAKDFVSLDKDSKRGVLEMFEEDAWPEKETSMRDFLPKSADVRVQHIRDALLMGTVAIMSPPQWAYTDERTA